MRLSDPAEVAEPLKSPLVELQGVSVVRDGAAILHRLDLRVDEGQHTAIIGPNGCGKSTLIKLLTREIYPHAGRGVVKILGRERWLQRELRTVIGVVSAEPKEPLLGDPTALDIAVSGLIGTYGVLWGYDVTPEMIERGSQALERVQAGHLANRKIETLSAGEHRRVFIARALISNPLALVLDEPTTSLDLKATHEFLQTMRRIAQSGTTLILVSHHLEEIVPEIQRVVLLRKGSVVADGLIGAVMTDAFLQEVFDGPIRLICRDPYRAAFSDA